MNYEFALQYMCDYEFLYQFQTIQFFIDICTVIYDNNAIPLAPCFKEYNINITYFTNVEFR